MTDGLRMHIHKGSTKVVLAVLLMQLQSIAFTDELRVVEDVRIQMRDGIELVGDVYLPVGGKTYPAILTVTPYSRARDDYSERTAQYLVNDGYAFVIVDTRGQGDSNGVFDFFRTDVDDNFDVIEWIARQDWSNGHVGMQGSSYTGANQWYAAKNRPPHLRCISPNAVVGRPMEELPRNGGAFKLRWALEWVSSLSDSGIADGGPIRDGEAIDYESALHQPLSTLDKHIFGVPLPLYRRFLRHDSFDEYWRPIQFTEADFRRLEIPALAFTGWFDGTLPGTVFYYRNMKEYSSADDRQYLVIGPWEHHTLSDGGRDYATGEKVTQIGMVQVPENGFLPARDLRRRFFDWCLKDGPEFEFPSAKIYVTGSNRWLDLETYPPQSDLRSLYLHSDGTATLEKGKGELSWSPPQDGEPPDRYVYDPLNPVPEYVTTRAGERIRLQSKPVDINQVQDRADVLVYESEPLEEAITVIGNVVLLLYAASDAPDTDFVSHIADVWPDRRAMKLGPQSGGIIRARYRNGFDKEELLIPIGEPAEFKIDYFDIGHTFLPGHRIRVSVTSSNYPWISANPNTGNPIGDDMAEPRPAQQTILHDADHPSRLLLPVFQWPE